MLKDTAKEMVAGFSSLPPISDQGPLLVVEVLAAAE
jgi:hypothetical protein